MLVLLRAEGVADGIDAVIHRVREETDDDLLQACGIDTDADRLGVHLNDVSLISPVHWEGELLGYVAGPGNSPSRVA